MKWSDLDKGKKIRLILEHVLQWKLFDTWDDFHAALWKSGEYVDVGYPVAFWNDRYLYSPEECWCVYHKRGEDAKIFDPLTSMDDAWKLTEQERFTSVSLERACMPSTDEKHTYLCGLSVERKWGYYVFGSTPQEAICLAALAANAVEVEP